MKTLNYSCIIKYNLYIIYRKAGCLFSEKFLGIYFTHYLSKFINKTIVTKCMQMHCPLFEIKTVWIGRSPFLIYTNLGWSLISFIHVFER